MPLDVEVWRERLKDRDSAAGRVALQAAAEDAAALSELAEDLASCGLIAAWACRAAANGDAALLEPLARLWHRADDEVADAWARLAATNQQDVPEAVARAAARHQRRLRLRDRARMAAAESPTVARWLESSVILRVRCDACGRDAPHATTTIFFDPERHGVDPNDGILTPQVLTCPHCGAEDEYTIDPTSAIEVATRALAAARLPETSSRGPWAVQLGRASLEDGTPIRRASDGLRILRQRAEARPSDPSGWRRLGNYAIRCDRFDEALDAWRRGAEIPRDFDCALAVAMEAVSRRTPAFDAVARAVERLPHADVSRRPLQAAQLAEAVRLVRDERPLTLSLGPIAIDLQSIEDWSRLGELLASKRVHSVTLRREPVADPVSLAVAAERLG